MEPLSSRITEALVAAVLSVSILLVGIKWLARREKSELRISRVLAGAVGAGLVVLCTTLIGIQFMDEWQFAPLAGFGSGFVPIYIWILKIAKKDGKQHELIQNDRNEN